MASTIFVASQLAVSNTTPTPNESQAEAMQFTAKPGTALHCASRSVRAYFDLILTNDHKIESLYSCVFIKSFAAAHYEDENINDPLVERYIYPFRTPPGYK